MIQGTVLDDKYEIEAVLGQGGFGITYLAEDLNLKASVAVKEFFPTGLVTRDKDYLRVIACIQEEAENVRYGKQKFLEEARRLSEFAENPHIVNVLNYFEENDTAYFVMNYIKGVDLKTYIDQQGGKVCWHEAWSIMNPVMEALSIVHGEGMIHRDVTPHNIFISEENVVKLLDFGAARCNLGDRSQTFDVILKRGYAPEEQYFPNGKQGAYTDVYSVAACFYKMLSGCVPSDALSRRKEDDLISLSSKGVELPKGADAAIRKGLSVCAEDRFSSMETFRQEILRSMSVEEEPKTGFSKKHFFALTGTVAAMVAVAVLVYAVSTDRQENINVESTRENTQNQMDENAWENGEVYQGDLENGKRSGWGICVYPNGDVYEGEWRDGKKNGEGHYTWSNGDEYEGPWADDEMVIQ